MAASSEKLAQAAQALAKQREEAERKQQAKEAAEREVERARGEGRLSGWDAAEVFEKGREAERDRAAAASATLSPREERKPEVSKEQEPEIDDGMDFGL